MCYNHKSNDIMKMYSRLHGQKLREARRNKAKALRGVGQCPQRRYIVNREEMLAFLKNEARGIA
ncbi:MAG: hypothetical protein ACI4MM_03580, partial [Candidatus Ventricola sp.]